MKQKLDQIRRAKQRAETTKKHKEKQERRQRKRMKDIENLLNKIESGRVHNKKSSGLNFEGSGYE